MRGSLEDGERLNFVPVEVAGPQALEVTVLTDGRLVLPDALGGAVLEAGPVPRDPAAGEQRCPSRRPGYPAPPELAPPSVPRSSSEPYANSYIAMYTFA